MNLKILAILTMIVSLILFGLVLVYKLPVSYVPNNASTVEYVLFTVVGVIIEAVIFSFLFMHMVKKSKLDFFINRKNMFQK